jgi:hypothetical protein
VSYDVSVHASSAALLDEVASRSGVLSAPGVLAAGECVRFDVVLRVPVDAKVLRVRAFPPTHLMFEGGADAVQGLDELEVLLHARDGRNVLVSHEDVQAASIHLSAKRGYLVGGVSISEVSPLPRPAAGRH